MQLAVLIEVLVVRVDANRLVRFPNKTHELDVSVLCLPVGSESMKSMLNIATETLPRTNLSYLAFRLAFQETLERIALARQIGDDTNGCFGYLTEVPFLCAVPPHIQLDLLAATWKKHVANEEFDADLVDESVIYAACETSARIVERETAALERYLSRGPVVVNTATDVGPAAALKGLHMNLASEGEFLLVSQFEDMPPDEAREMKKRLQIDEQRTQVMFDVLGRWNVSPDFLGNLSGLLTRQEILRMVRILGVK